MTFDELVIGNTYTFTTHSPAFLGSVISRAKLQAIVNTDTARRFAEVDMIYASIFPTLPSGSVRNIQTRKWFLFKEQNGNLAVICDQWIVENTIELIETVTYTITIANAALGKAEQIKAALAGIGIIDPVIEVI